MSAERDWETRVSVLVGELRTESGEPPERLPDRVMRTARWQHTARGTLLAITQVAAAVAQGTALVLGLDGDREERP